jgi:signal transduction histidine kinase
LGDTGLQQLIDVNETVNGALRILAEELDYHGVRTRIQLTPHLPLVASRGSQLQEVFVNLINNAVEAMDGVTDGRRVLTLRTRYDGEKMIVVEVEDSGPGIDPSNAERVFAAFVTTKPTGIGLGLAICRMFIDRHGGELSQSPAQPRGAVFRIVLPRRDVAAH